MTRSLAGRLVASDVRIGFYYGIAQAGRIRSSRSPTRCKWFSSQLSNRLAVDRLGSPAIKCVEDFADGAITRSTRRCCPAVSRTLPWCCMSA